MTTRGRFIAFEGCDASGKSTQSRRWASQHGAVWTREPGDTPVGSRIRALLLDHSPEGASLHPRAEALLMAADRAQHVHELIEPTLFSGRDVVTDRYFGSSVAYQGAGRELGEQEIQEISLWATAGLRPDVTVLLRVDVETALARLQSNGEFDRIESEGAAFLQRVIVSYDRQARSEPDWVVVNGEGSIDDVAALVDAALAGHSSTNRST